MVVFLYNPLFWVAFAIAMGIGGFLVLLASRPGSIFGPGHVTYGKSLVIEGQRVRLPSGETGRIYFADFGAEGSYRLGLYDVTNPKTGFRTNNAFLVGAGDRHIFLPVVPEEQAATRNGGGGAFDMAKELLDLREENQKLAAQNQQLVEILKPRRRGRPAKPSRPAGTEKRRLGLEDIMGRPEPGEEEGEGEEEIEAVG